MDDIASLGLRIDAAQASVATAALDKMAAAGGRAEAAANKLSTAEQRLEKSTGAAADAAMDAVRAAQLLAGEQEAVIGTANRLNAAHGKVINTSKVLQQTTLNLGRQFSDIGVQLAGGQRPLLVLTQQLPQIADGFAVAAQQGLGFKAVMAGLRTQALALVATFGPWIAGITAIGAGVFYLWNQHEKAKKKAEELTKQIDEMSKALEKSVPSLVDQANSSEVAAEGARNFEAWLAKSNASLATYAERLKTATVNQYMLAAATTKAAADELRQANTRKTARALVYTGGGGVEGLRRYQAELAQAEENLRLADARAKAAMDAPLKAFTDNHSKAAKAVKETTREIALFTDVLVAEKEIWPERDAALQAAERQTKALASAQQALNDNIKASDRPATGLENMATELQRVADEAYAVTRTIEDIAYAINKNDWTSALAGLVNVLANVSTAFKNAATAKEKYAAVAQLAQGVGSAIGGKGGAVVGGAGSGALAGLGVASSLTTLGLAVPGPGWALAAGGAILGALGGLFGSSKAKKQEKAEAEARRLAEEQARLQAVANEARSLEIQKIELTFGALAAEVARREDVLKAMDASNQAAQKEVWALQDAAAAKARDEAVAAEAAQRASDIAATRRDLEIQLLEAQDKGSEAAKMRLADERALLDESLQNLFDQVQAERELTLARNEAEAQAQRLANQQKSIQDRIDELTLSSSQMLLKKRDEEMQAALKLDASLGPLLKALYGLEDAATAAATAAEDAANKAKTAADLRTAQQSDAASLVAAARQNLKAAYDAQVSEIKAGRDQMAGYAASFREFRLGLSGAAETGANFYAIAAKARLGDTDAMGQLVGAAQAANSSAMSGASTQLEFLREQARIRAAVQAAEDTATRQVSIADKQLAALEAQVAGFITVNESVLTVAAGIAGVISAINVLNATFGGAMANPGRSWGANPEANKALARAGYAGDFGSGGFQAWAAQQDETTRAKLREILTQQGQAYRIAFASGGVFTSPTDFRMGPQLGQMAEAGPEAIMPLVQTSGGLGVRAVGSDNADLKAEIRDLKETVNAALIAIAKNTSRGARAGERHLDLFGQVTEGGDAMRTTEAA